MASTGREQSSASDRTFRGPAAVSILFSQTVTPMPPGEGPIFFSGRDFPRSFRLEELAISGLLSTERP